MVIEYLRAKWISVAIFRFCYRTVEFGVVVQRLIPCDPESHLTCTQNSHPPFSHNIPGYFLVLFNYTSHGVKDKHRAWTKCLDLKISSQNALVFREINCAPLRSSPVYSYPSVPSLWQILYLAGFKNVITVQISTAVRVS